MKLLVAFAGLFWLMITVWGVVYLNGYESKPGPQSSEYPSTTAVAAADDRPEDPVLKANGRPQLLFFAHPKCPCTKASLRELSRLMGDTNGRMDISIIFAIPEGLDRSFADTELKTFAEALPNARVIVDENESITKQFGAETSGLVLLYDAAGKVRFHGGITSARGHEGDSAGKNAIYKLVMEGASDRDNSPVYGCPLHKKDCSGEELDHTHE